MSFDVHHQWITGCVVGVEYEEDDAAAVLAVDLFIVRLHFYKWKDQ